jgi:hypothetical protein
MPSVETWLEFKKANEIPEVKIEPEVLNTVVKEPKGVRAVDAKTMRSRFVWKPPLEDLSHLIDDRGRMQQERSKAGWNNIPPEERIRRAKISRRNGLAMKKRKAVM